MDSTEAEALLATGRDGVNQWNRHRERGDQQPLRLQLDNLNLDADWFTMPSLRGVDFGGCELAASRVYSADLSNANLHAADLSDARIFGSSFSDADLSEANLSGAMLDRSVFDRANLTEALLANAAGPASFLRAHMERAILAGANFDRSEFAAADLRGADLERGSFEGACLDGANLAGARLSNAKLQKASFVGANLDGADLSYADLTGAVLDEARMIGTNLSGTVLDGCSVYGISAWDVVVDEATRQRDLNIGREGQAAITVDDLEMAQFMYMLMNNSKLRNVIDTITSKVVLILGRFTENRLPVLQAMREALRQGDFDYVPVVFDFDKPASRSTAETVATVASMARFVIADLSDAKSVLQELREIVPSRPSLPVQPLLVEGDTLPGMLDFFKYYPWFLEPYIYTDAEALLAELAELIRPAIEMSNERRGENGP